MGNWRNGNLVAKNLTLTELCSRALWKIEPKMNEQGYLAEEIFK